MFTNADLMDSWETMHKTGAPDLDLANLDDHTWLSATTDVPATIPDVDGYDQAADFPVVPPFDAEFADDDRADSLFDVVGIAKPEPHFTQQTSSSSSLESWQGDLAARPAPPSRAALLRRSTTTPIRRVETSASALTSLDCSPLASSPVARVAQAALRPCHSLPDLARAASTAARQAGRGRNSTVATSPPKNLGVDTRSLEQKRDDRMAALDRFREKKRNRTFTKKVRYECRKQLADSRPRVKGRFVKKNEIGLYEKYGEAYREHLEELEDCMAPIPL